MEKIKNYLFKREEIIFAYLYGSMARETANRLSDIDIAIYIEKSKKPASGTFGYRSELIAELQSLVKREVDLIILNEISLSLAFNVLKEGKLLFTKSDKRRINFHESIMRRYLDFLPVFKVQEKYLKDKLVKGDFGR
ncbi:MAG: type VII toxin-antitoxin system MntA family adenylyltransferase antitoxin [Halanaerobium sp.]